MIWRVASRQRSCQLVCQWPACLRSTYNKMPRNTDTVRTFVQASQQVRKNDAHIHNADWLIQRNELNNNILSSLSTMIAGEWSSGSDWRARSWSRSYTWRSSTSSTCTRSGSGRRPGVTCSHDHSTSTDSCLSETRRPSDTPCSTSPRPHMRALTDYI